MKRGFIWTAISYSGWVGEKQEAVKIYQNESKFKTGRGGFQRYMLKLKKVHPEIPHTKEAFGRFQATVPSPVGKGGFERAATDPVWHYSSQLFFEQPSVINVCWPQVDPVVWALDIPCPPPDSVSTAVLSRKDENPNQSRMMIYPWHSYREWHGNYCTTMCWVTGPSYWQSKPLVPMLRRRGWLHGYTYCRCYNAPCNRPILLGIGTNGSDC